MKYLSKTNVPAVVGKSLRIVTTKRGWKQVINKMDIIIQSILAKAFRGELAPQNPNDEPAEKLLERVKEEKEKQDPKIKKSRVKDE